MVPVGGTVYGLSTLIFIGFMVLGDVDCGKKCGKVSENQ
jgi:hypothetical protein